MNKDKIIEAYKSHNIGVDTLIDLCKLNKWTLIFKPNGQVRIDEDY